jgi:hypothetical protein
MAEYALAIPPYALLAKPPATHKIDILADKLPK